MAKKAVTFPIKGYGIKELKQAAKQLKKRRFPRPWTKEDVRELRTHSKMRTPVTDVAKVMKRTVGALRRRAGILRIGIGHRR